MKKTITILQILFSLTMYGQDEKKIMFKTLYFNLESKVVRTEIDTIACSGILGIDFYRNKFYTPYHYPRPFINKKYRNETIVVWSDTTVIKDYNKNWTYTYKFDSLSRVIEYKYSGCFICSQLPYNFQILYDNKNRPNRIINKYSEDAISKGQKPDEEFIFLYDEKDNIIQLRHFTQGNIDKQINKI